MELLLISAATAALGIIFKGNHEKVTSKNEKRVEELKEDLTEYFERGQRDASFMSRNAKVIGEKMAEYENLTGTEFPKPKEAQTYGGSMSDLLRKLGEQ